MVIENGRLIKISSIDQEELFIPEGVTTIGSHAAYGNRTLRYLHISPNTLTIGKQAFAFCEKLERIELLQGLKRLDSGCFQGCVSLRSIEIPASVSSLHNCVFKGCSSLASISLSQNLRRNIESETFAGCTALNRIVLPPNVQQIKAGAFAHCTSLCDIVFMNPDIIIDRNAFYDCPSLSHTILEFIEAHQWQDDTIDINSRASGPAGRLSNYTERCFVLDGIQCRSIEGVLQSLKTADLVEQQRICLLSGGWATKAGREHDWKAGQRLFWRGVPYERLSKEYEWLLTHIFDAVFDQDPGFRADLEAMKGKKIDHRMGTSNPSETVLTRLEFLRQLKRLMNKV